MKSFNRRGFLGHAAALAGLAATSMRPSFGATPARVVVGHFLPRLVSVFPLPMSPYFRISRPISSLGLAFLLSAVPVSAQDAAPPAPTLSLGDALRRAAEQNPRLAAQGYAERAAEALIEQAGMGGGNWDHEEGMVVNGGLLGVAAIPITIGLAYLILSFFNPNKE